MKKWFIIVPASLIALIFLALFLVPVLFKDDIQKGIDTQLDSSLKAEVFYDLDKLNLSFFSHFPSLTVSFEDFGIKGKEVFAKDTLVSLEKFEVSINVISLFGDQIEVNGIYLVKPNINVIVLEDGRANYDIAIADSLTVEEESAADTSGASFNVGIKEWMIEDGMISYEDKSSDIYARIVNLDHSGSGDFTQDVFDLKTQTDIEALFLEMAGVSYLDDNTFSATVDLNMNMPESKYTFSDNSIRLNALELGIDGFVILKEAIEMDLNLNAKKTQFKEVLSLVPAIYKEDFDNIKTSGNFSFKSFAKGTYLIDTTAGVETYPDFGLALKVSDGMFKYPDLPKAVENIEVDLNVKNMKQSLQYMDVALNKLHVDLGPNPIDARIMAKGDIENIDLDLDAELKAAVQLADLNSFLPLEDISLKGLFKLDAFGKGKYNESTLPDLKADIMLSNGYVKTADFPEAIESLQFQATATAPAGSMEEFHFYMPQFSMLLQNRKFNAALDLHNLNNYRYDFQMDGSVDLEKIFKIYPLEGMDLKGILNMDIQTSGNYDAVMAQRYNELPTSGSIQVQNFNFVSEDLPYGFGISEADMSLNPEKILLKKFEANLGKSQMQLNGTLSNYIAYMMDSMAVVYGDFEFYSSYFNANEFLSDDDVEEVESESTEDTSAMEVVPIPKTIAFDLNAKMDKVIYDNYDIDNLEGGIKIKDGVVYLQQTKFNMIGGEFITDGMYSTVDPSEPLYDFSLNINRVEIKKAYETFNTIKAFAPIGEKVEGLFNTNFKIGGALDNNMMPKLSTISGQGKINILEAIVENLKFINSISKATEVPLLKGFASDNTASKAKGPLCKVKDVIVSAAIENGRVFFEPFDFNAGGQVFTIAGSNGLDGTLDYKLSTLTETAGLGQAASGLLNSVSGISLGDLSEVIVNLGVTGTAEDPKVKVLSIERPDGETGSTSVKNVVKQEVDEQINKAREEAMNKARKEADEILRKAQEQADRVKREARNLAGSIRSEANKRADQIEKSASNPLEKAAKKAAAQKVREEGNKKANQVIKEADQKADQIMKEARQRADQKINSVH